MNSPVFASRDLLAALAASGLSSGFLECVFVDGATLVLGATNETGVPIVEATRMPEWATGGEPAVMPWRSITSESFEQWKDNGFRSFEGIELGLDLEQEEPKARVLVMFEGHNSFAVIADNVRPNRRFPTIVEVVEPRPRLESDRNDGIAGCSVLIIGAGSLGSHLARALLEWGFRRFQLIDKDWLEAGNLPLHACGPEWVGAAKAKAVAKDLERVHGTSASGWRFDVLGASEGTRDVIAEADLVIVSVDDATTRAWINHTVVSLGIPTLFAALYRTGTIGESLLVNPGGPCLNCSRVILPFAAATETDITPSAYRNGLLTSIYGLSSLVTGMIASVLAPGARGVGPLQAPLALWSPIAQSDLDDPFKFALPNQTNWIPLPFDTSCTVCRGGKSAISEEHRNRMQERLENSA